MKYQPPWWGKNGHFQSIYPSLFRKLSAEFYTPERINTSDGDFLDLDWARADHKRLVILTHGLEGHSRRPYMLGMAKAALEECWDVLAWNFRSCSGEPNRLLKSYHSGATHDLEHVIKYAASKNYQEIALIGFSVGGNKTLIHLGKNASTLAPEIIGSVTFSVPCDLTSASKTLAQTSNKLYMKNFLMSLEEKLKIKKQFFPNDIDLTGYSKIKTFREYDERYTAPINGFKSAEDYWLHSSSKQYIGDIKIPTLMISARDDPFLPPECYPEKVASQSKYLTLETPTFGGHIGFMQPKNMQRYWSEQRAMNYICNLSKMGR